MYYTYILKSSIDGTKYIGHTSDLKNRVKEHNRRQSKYTSTKAPFVLVWYCAFKTKEKAISFERYLKSSSGFAFANKRLI
ncbi:TPA: excinuclease ABC subunit C [Candidatus Nomurabacteria bacterium]|uniref:Excinuclease ABC subunit C n=1 Tax=Candidatus Nomurabacteria bacterium RIFOXYA2_FULL_42_12 TaxID=1801801 RepID=A0A1F6YN77_9BACT|nr:MAG: excinuclease ABC subunit C [Candidatus Nomurabacteria bacterium RIFCSPHIGHO2_01_FULL_43_16]OGI96945.1 MAG: excinuclease ABC subunit C [Candidatus Nomurabacteria bacterium RIFCSPLOWO2_01_FULL_43_15]OGJ04614.1 MAG: excinuclease ABC subunit C [Candidatus Nomurabacteria bacterium RIFOXYB1_FULL_43_14]OGJ07529.1 MAG: excinuclease ABC subunit C [Candidatus Nomurabacteria bacterium RIFOXYA1_FULL_42_12]OGJ07787.1 MAG: excinuclease ABC subunit C [Candidatus Nomurabacteria bacterium RIFOXYA2_FULL_